jgi:hypothetical protein
VVFVGVGSELLRLEGGQVEVWGEGEGFSDGRILALEVLFEDLWLVQEGGSEPLRFLQGSQEFVLPGEGGPAGAAVSLAVDEKAGQLWVGMEDGKRGGMASLSREGVWISQLRLPGPPLGLAAYGGAVVASCSEGLILLEAGERLRRTLGPEQGLPCCAYSSLGLIPGEILVETEMGLYRSLLEGRKSSEEAPREEVQPPVVERIEV